jgi:hypothetical protein
MFYSHAHTPPEFATQNMAATGSIGINSDNSYNYMTRFQAPSFIIDTNRREVYSASM